MDASISRPEQGTIQRAGFQISLLGPPTITWNERTWVIKRRSVRALLYRLACDPEPVCRGNLQLLFWPDSPEPVARRNLSHHLTHLRRSLPLEDVLVTDQERVCLKPGVFWCDALQFRNASSEPSPLSQRIALYRGPFLQGFDLPTCDEFERWCAVERVALENEYLRSLEVLVDDYTSRGETSRAIQTAQRYLETDPLSERMHQRLIQLFAAVGDRHLALQQFERCSSLLASELGVNPLPETWGMYQAVLNSRTRFPLPVAPLRPQNLPGMETPILDRDYELGVLNHAFAHLQSNNIRVILISGEAGIGKSRLMCEVARDKQDQAFLLFGTAQAGEESIPYQPVLDAFRTILGLKGSRMKGVGSSQAIPSSNSLVDPIWLSEISRLLPELNAAYPGMPPPLTLEPEFARARLLEGLCRLVLSCAQAQGPLLLCLDDLQWIDSSTKAWLIHLGRLLENGGYPILILGTYRSEEAGALLDLRHHLARVGVLLEIKLQGLREAAVLQLLQCITGAKSREELFAGRLHKATGGNPFYLIEVLRQLVEEGTIEEHFNGPMEFKLPESIREAIQASLDRLSPLARQVLEAGAILGLSFSPDLLRLTAGRSLLEILEATEELTGRLLLVEKRGEYHFVHELTRQHVEANLSQVRRQLLHRRAGRALRRLQPGAHTLLAHHFELGDEPQKALHYHKQANLAAQAIYAWQVAEFHQGRILDLLAFIDSSLTRPEYIHLRAEVLAERAHSRYLQGDLAGRDLDLVGLFDLGEACNDDQVRLQAVFHRLRYLNLDGEYQQAIDVAEKGLALLRSSTRLSKDAENERISRARLLAQIGFANYFLGKPLEALGVLEDARTLCQENAEPEACGRIHHILGYVFFHLGDYRRSLEHQQCAYDCHKETGDFNRMAWDLIDIGAMHKNLGDLDWARRYMEEGLELSHRVGAHPAEAYALAHFGSLELYKGDYTAAVAHYRQALEKQQAVHSEHIVAATEAGIGLAYYHLGDWFQSRHWLERGLQRARATGHRRRIAETLVQLGLLDIEAGCLDLARPHLDEGLAVAQDCQSGEGMAAGLAALARLERLAGDPARALALSIEAACAAEQTHIACCEMWAEIEAGLACLALGKIPSALKHTQCAVDLAEKASQDWIGYEEAHRAHARALRSSGHDKKAAEQERRADVVIQAKAMKIADTNLRLQYLKKVSSG